jgi:hypothetical protein
LQARLGGGRNGAYVSGETRRRWAKMMYLLAIFCSPLALLFTGKPFQALFNLVLYILSLVAWITIILHSLGFTLWALAFLHAALAIHSAHEDRRARMIADAMRR